MLVDHIGMMSVKVHLVQEVYEGGGVDCMVWDIVVNKLDDKIVIPRF